MTTYMDPGDSLVLFTDGLLEAVAGHGETDDSALRQILRTVADRPAREVADRLDAAIGSAITRDDAAFLVVRTR